MFLTLFGIDLVYGVPAIILFTGLGAVWGALRLNRSILRQLSASEKRFRFAAATANDVVYEWNSTDDSIQWFGEIASKIGCASNELPKTRNQWNKYIVEEDRAAVIAQIKENLEKKIPLLIEYRVRTKNNNLIYCLETASPQEDGSSWIGTISDITHRKQVEMALRESQEFLTAAMDALPERIAILDENGIALSLNAAWRQSNPIGHFGSALVEGLNYFQICQNDSRVKPPEAVRLINGLRDVLKKRADEFQSEYVLQEPYQSPEWHLLSARRFRESGPIRVIVSHQLITPRKQAEHALAQERDILDQIMNNIPDSIYLKDLHSRYLRLNKAHARVLGIKNPDDAIGKTDSAFFPKEIAEELMNSGIEVFKTEQPIIDRRIILRSSTGQEYHFSITKVPFFNRNGEIIGLIGVNRDVTERETLEEQLRHSQKMEAIGRLAGGVAHDFNNLLTVIRGWSHLLLENERLDSPQHDQVKEIDKAADRGASLIRQLLAFSRKQVAQKRPMQLNQLVDDMAKMLKRLVGDDIRLTTQLAPHAGSILADPGQIEQVVMNLVVNACDAMPNGGEIVVATSLHRITEDEAPLSSEIKPGDYVVLSVRDTGMGISPEIKNHLFEPFFTTKPKGQGTGLGLATVYGIVKQYEGHILVESSSRQGAEFRVYFPKLKEVESSTPPPLGNPATASRGHETIVLAEDDPALRELSSLILRAKGYQVHEAENGLIAKNLLEKIGDTVNLVVTDVIMPEMNGKVLGDWIKKNHPRIRVVYTSGYTDDAIIPQNEPDSTFVPKPFTPEELCSAVRQMLDQMNA